MSIVVKNLAYRTSIPFHAINTIFLAPDNWDDYGYKTLFQTVFFDHDGVKHHLGSIKIGFCGQESGWTNDALGDSVDQLPENFFSLGQDADFYKNLVDKFPLEIVSNLLASLNDVVFNTNLLDLANNENVFKTSLLRSVNSTLIKNQFQRILKNEAPLTDFNFTYEKSSNDRYSGIKLNFSVKPHSKPPSNIHVLIGRNGVGKTTLLNNMVDALLPNRGPEEQIGFFSTALSDWLAPIKFKEDYFAGIVSISFSAFDPFLPPKDQKDANLGMKYTYVGLKKRSQNTDDESWVVKSKDDLAKDFASSLKLCLSLTAKSNRWEKAVKKLESDFNFAEMSLCSLLEIYKDDMSVDKNEFYTASVKLFNRMSSGHAIVLLTITRLVDTVEEKTLVLLDEPESHLHPPLLSAFTRALSDLLTNRNGVAIIATHSPVLLQEVPKACVSIIRRIRLTSTVDRPENETFAENVGVLTREVFGLEVTKSGYHELLEQSVSDGKTYEEIESEYDNQLGFEGKAILRAMIILKNSDLG
ncbi:AAA family ATPase [Acinetobacter baumannii]|uniref:AAA family ATPase n=1 Tax=Acinetobacter baumannii TaxID=470 RepID=UPI0023410730|nr:AAA family ATPase [Acinetobacter baumannii]